MIGIATLIGSAEVLADNNFGDTRSGSLAGPTGLVIILLLVAGTIFLIRSMNTHLRRVPERFQQPPAPGDHESSDVEDAK
jgi:hypothetical protein